jgi:hypothetical protein
MNVTPDVMIRPEVESESAPDAIHILMTFNAMVNPKAMTFNFGASWPVKI